MIWHGNGRELEESCVKPRSRLSETMFVIEVSVITVLLMWAMLYWLI